METLYGLKRKTTNRWLKLLLLLFVAVGFGIPNVNAQTKAIKVANDQQLIEAMDNPSISFIEFVPGYYAYLNIQATEGTTLTKTKGSDGSRESTGCTYTIKGENNCYSPIDQWYDASYGWQPIGYSHATAQAGVVNTTCFSWPDAPCCPVDGSGYWTVTEKPGSADVIFYDTTNYNMDFYVDKPGKYKLKYIWDMELNDTLKEDAEVETEYNFYGPEKLELNVPDVCGTYTEYDFTVTPGYLPEGYEIVWTLDDFPYGDPVTYDGPTVTGEDYPLTVECCGLYILTVKYYSRLGEEPCIVEVSDTIEFSCQPYADAGEDAYICNDNCYWLTGNTGLGIYECSGHVFSDNYAYTFVQFGGPYPLQGLPAGSTVQDSIFNTEVCRAERDDIKGICPYGVYDIEFQVINGLCDSSDQMQLTFYEMPKAIAGDDQHICNTFSFSLAAVPFDYCGEDGLNYWSHSWWELLSQPDDCTVNYDPSDDSTMVDVTNCDPAPACAYGPYVFVWHELNVKIDENGDTLWGETHCYDSDTVVVYIYEDPEPDAGEDLVLCDTWAFSLWGMGDEPCYENTVVQYSWEKSAQPGNCMIRFTDINTTNPDITIGDCDKTCPYGEYIFTLTQCNGYYENDEFVEVCCSTDDVSVWILEPVDADAGPDQHICSEFAFTVTADLTQFCGKADTNYFTWGEWKFVSGPSDAVELVIVNDSTSKVTVDTTDVPCPYGMYTFRWTEYNGFGVPFQGCIGYDEVDIYIYETPYDVNAGDDMEFCESDISGDGMLSFYLNGAADRPCTEGWAYSIGWEVYSQPGDCDISLSPLNGKPPDPGIGAYVSISNCEPCQFGEYVFTLTQQNGYYDITGLFVMVCEWTDTVSVWIYEQPTNVDAGENLLLCDEFTFDLTADPYDYCGDFGVNYNNWYSWTLVSQPDDCDVIITNGTDSIASVSIENCTEGECQYGEYIFRFTEYNGSDLVYCETWDEVSVFIFEMPVADAGDDYHECIDITDQRWCYHMTGSLDYCYSMYGVWTKSCGPGSVTFDDIHDTTSGVCFGEPGRYIFTWTVWNAAEGCEASDDVLFDLIEQPTADAKYKNLLAPCDSLCYSLDSAGIIKYEYFGNDTDTCPNYWDKSHWTYVSGPTGDPAEVSFADDTDPATELCVSTFGCYTVQWIEVNKPDDKDYYCADSVDVFVQFVETPEPDAGNDTSICDHCYTMQAVPFVPSNCTAEEGSSMWMFLGYEPPVDPCPTDEFSIQYTYAFNIQNIYNHNAKICISDDCLGSHYGTYGFVWVNTTGYCTAYDTVYIEFKKKPVEVALEGLFDPSNCAGISENPWDCPDCEVDCLYPEQEVIEVCAGSCLDWSIDWDCSCYGMPIPGYTYEWSFIGPSGSFMEADPYWYDCAEECWKGSDNVHICFGECCDTARLYLTITTPQGCSTTEEWKFYVNHKPCANIEGPEVSEVDAIATYCNVCPEEYDMDCLLYTWTAEHCGHIVDGQGTECIDVLWTDYNINGGWGEITMTVFDTCTGCCNYDEMLVKIWPQYTLGDDTLSGQVFYDHRDKFTPNDEVDIPLNGVHITLLNGTVPVFETDSYVKFVEIDDTTAYSVPGYYEFPGIYDGTEFDIQASYDGTWCGANATDALAVQLKVIGSYPLAFYPLVGEAMDVNNSNTISATDALWIKQRAIGMVTYFPAGNWVFEPNMKSYSGTYDIYTLNAGDANRDNIPASTKEAPAIDLITDGSMNVVTGQVFTLPIRIADASQFGAITLDLGYNPALIDVVEVNTVDGMIANIAEGNVGIAYSNVNPMILAENDVVVILKVKALSQFTSAESLFSIGLNSEFADAGANVIQPVRLKTYGVTTSPAAADYFLSANRPNPFNNSTFIEYTMPESGKVKLSVLDMLGQEIAVLVDATQSAGSYTVEFSAAGLATGVYIYKITVDGETRDFISTQRMVISH